jgi:glycerate 2-kinase
MTLKDTAREIFLGTLRECTVESAFARQLSFETGVLTVAGENYPLASYSQVLTIAIGKAAHSMAEALQGRIGEFATGIIASPVPAVNKLAGFTYFEGGHPLPNPASLAAGTEILRRLQALPANALVLFLISGGASAAVESPIAQLTLEDIVALNRVLLHSGANIAEMNAIRKHLSVVKGGRLAQAAAGATKISLLVSDVPESALDALASGPTLPDSSTCEDFYSIVERYGLAAQLPDRVRGLVDRRTLEETPKTGDPAFAKSQWTVLLSSEEAQRIATQMAREAGFTVKIDNTCDDWEYSQAADYLLTRLRGLRKKTPRACIISGGEVTVRIPAECGIGGRNQQFALYCAEKIEGENIAVLSAGTDGIDGNSQSAGSVVDGTTVSHVGKEQLRAALMAFDANRLLRRIGDAIETGPTGNNLRDLRVLLAE